MTIVSKLVAKAVAEWERWGFSSVPVHGKKAIGGVEGSSPFVNYVNDYWRVVGKPTWNGKTAQPWSAAFISFCFKEAGAGKGFPYNSGHAGYCGAFIRNPAKYPGLTFSDPATTRPSPGDLVFAARSGPDCVAPPGSHAKALAELQKAGGWFCSHADIVVETRDGEIDVIGGNVSNSVTMTTYVAEAGIVKDPRHTWLAIVKNGL